MVTLKVNKIFVVVMLVYLTSVSIRLCAQDKELKIESDGFRWYELYQDGIYGAQSVNGNTLIPLSRGYEMLVYTKGRFWMNKHLDGEWREGVCDKNGKEILAPKYDYIYDFVEEEGQYYVVINKKKGIFDKNGKEIITPKYDDVCKMKSGCWKKTVSYEYYEVKLNGKYGACNMNGCEIVSPKYESLICLDGFFNYEDATGKWVSTDITLEKNNVSNYTSNTSSSSSSSSSSIPTSSNTESGLLYEGDYTEGAWINPNTGHSQPAPMPNHHIKIYEDHIIIDMVSLPYQGKSINGEKMYVNSWSNITYYVDGFYNISSTFPYGYSQFSKGNVVYDMNAPVQGGYDNNNNNSYGTTPQKHEHGTREVTETCPVCHSTGNCQTCLGRGWRTLTDNSTQQCPTCKGNKVCWKCNGTGKITKTVRY